MTRYKLLLQMAKDLNGKEQTYVEAWVERYVDMAKFYMAEGEINFDEFLMVQNECELQWAVVNNCCDWQQDDDAEVDPNACAVYYSVLDCPPPEED